MKTLSLQEIKNSQLQTLLILRNFCERNNLKYYLAFGTLLGAVRHKGFIPWDDDADVFMPREDYNVLLKTFNTDIFENRKVISKENCPEFYLDFAKIIDCNTTVIELGQSLEIGVWVDIFPMDYLKDDEKLIVRTNKKIGFLNPLIHYATLKPSRSRSEYKNFIIRCMNVLIPSNAGKWLNDRRQKYIDRIVVSYRSNTYGLLYRNFGRYGLPWIPVSCFEPPEQLIFEGNFFCVPKEYDKLLTWFYGNYMALPPKRKQVSNHSYICCRKK